MFEVAREVAGDDQHGVDPDDVAARTEARGKQAGSDRDPGQALPIERPIGGMDGCALLDLDEGKRLSAAHDEVDFAPVDPDPLGEKSPAL